MTTRSTLAYPTRLPDSGTRLAYLVTRTNGHNELTQNRPTERTSGTFRNARTRIRIPR